MPILQLNENEQIINDKESMTLQFGLRGFKIEGIETVSIPPLQWGDQVGKTSYRIYGRISGELCYFDIDNHGYFFKL